MNNVQYEVRFEVPRILIKVSEIGEWMVQQSPYDPGTDFQPLASLNETQLSFLKNFSWPDHVPASFKNALAALDTPAARLAIEPIGFKNTKAEDSQRIPAEDIVSEPKADTKALQRMSTLVGIMSRICQGFAPVNRGTLGVQVGGCIVERRPDQKWVVMVLSIKDGQLESLKENEFPTIELAAEYIIEKSLY